MKELIRDSILTKLCDTPSSKAPFLYGPFVLQVVWSPPARGLGWYAGAPEPAPADDVAAAQGPSGGPGTEHLPGVQGGAPRPRYPRPDAHQGQGPVSGHQAKPAQDEREVSLSSLDTSVSSV